MKKLTSLLLLTLPLGLFVACGGDDENLPAATTAGTASSAASSNSEPFTLRLGYFANITHSQPLVGLNNGIFVEELGQDVTIEEKTFNAGPSVIEALFAGEIDASFIGPNPAINGYIQSGGEALRIVAGATSGGALFIVDPRRASPSRQTLTARRSRRRSSATPRTSPFAPGSSSRAWAQRKAAATWRSQPIANSDTLALFQQGALDGAWVPEPWATRLVAGSRRRGLPERG